MQSKISKYSNQTKKHVNLQMFTRSTIIKSSFVEVIVIPWMGFSASGIRLRFGLDEFEWLLPFLSAYMKFDSPFMFTLTFTSFLPFILKSLDVLDDCCVCACVCVWHSGHGTGDGILSHNSLLNGAFGIIKSGISAHVFVFVLAKAPTFIVSLSDALFSSLQQ